MSLCVQAMHDPRRLELEVAKQRPHLRSAVAGAVGGKWILPLLVREYN
jgi:hypothetical protein